MLNNGKTDLFKHRRGDRKPPCRGSVGQKVSSKSHQKRRKRLSRTFQRLDGQKEYCFSNYHGATIRRDGPKDIRNKHKLLHKLLLCIPVNGPYQ